MIKVGIVGVGHLGEIHLKLILSSINFDLIVSNPPYIS